MRLFQGALISAEVLIDGGLVLTRQPASLNYIANNLTGAEWAALADFLRHPALSSARVILQVRSGRTRLKDLYFVARQSL